MSGVGTTTITVLFTDIEGSTRLWERHGDAMAQALAEHDRLLREVIERHAGVLVKETGDGVLAAFDDPVSALAAAAEAQRGVARSDWGELGALRVRMAVHTGRAERREGDYHGPSLNRAARLMAIGHGGQVLVSDATRSLVEGALPEGFELVDLGEHRLRDLSEPEHVYQLLAAQLPSEFPPLRSVDAFPTNLPVQLTSFVGRDDEVVSIAKLLERSRLITIIGVGGVGKTRLALAAAAEVLDHFGDGTWLVELETVTDDTRVADVVAAALRVQPSRTTSTEAALLNALASRQLLLVLDNCEHLVAPCARLVTALLRAAPNVVVLATSREPLGVAGETVVPVRPLDVDGAVRLFTERAAAADATSGIAAAELADVEQVCRGLDGIPLAIELAAARVRSIGAAELARRLDQRFRLLTGGRGAVDRHQTLRATIDWSYELLTPAERAVLARMSVFAGGCSLEAAEAILADGELDVLDVVDALAGLADKSLAVVDHTNVGVRYRLLETVRAYAIERLMTSGDAHAIRHRHAEHFQAFARLAARGLFSSDEHVWAARIEPDLGNLRAAVDWAVEVGDTDTAMSIAASFVRQALERPHWGTASLAEAALASAGAPTHDLRGRVLAEAAFAARNRGDEELARSRLMAAMDAIRSGARFTAAPWSYAMERPEWWGDLTQLLALVDEAIALAEAAGDSYSAAGMRATRCICLLCTDDTSAALELADAVLEEAAARGQPSFLATALMVRATVLIDVGKIADAAASARRALELMPGPTLTVESASAWRSLATAEALAGNGIAAVEALAAVLHWARSDARHAAATLRDAPIVFNALNRPDLTALLIGTPGEPPNVLEQIHGELRQQAFAAARQTLGDDAYERLVAEGTALRIDEVLQLVLSWLDDLLLEPWARATP